MGLSLCLLHPTFSSPCWRLREEFTIFAETKSHTGIEESFGLLSPHRKALQSCLLLPLHLQCELSHQTLQEETRMGTRARNNGTIVGTVLWILSSSSASSRWQTHNKMQSESRKVPKTKPDLNLVNRQFSHQSALDYYGLRKQLQPVLVGLLFAFHASEPQLVSHRRKARLGKAQASLSHLLVNKFHRTIFSG